MLDSNDLYNSIKLAAMKAVETSKPSDFLFGTVVSDSPLRISIEQKLTLGSAQLVLTRNVTDFKITITDGEKREVTIHNGLKVNDKVVLIKQKGGQKFLVVDRVVSST